MAHQPQEKRLPVLKLFKSKLKKQPQLLPLPEFPAERCADQPERAELFLSMKYARKRHFNRKRRYRCVLEAGLLELHDPNNRDINSFSIEYRIDLAKVVVMYDEQRLVLKLQKEVLFLYPATVTMERFREIVRLHSLWSQQKAVEGGEKPPATTTTTQGHEADVVSTNGTTATDETTAANPMHEYLRVLHATQLSVLDVSSRNLEQQVLLAEEMKRLYEHLKKTRAQTVKKQPKATATKIPEVKKDVEKKKKAEEPAPPAVKKPDESKRDETEAEDDDEEEEGQSSRVKKN